MEKQVWFASNWGVHYDNSHFESFVHLFVALFSGLLLPIETSMLQEFLVFAFFLLKKL